MGKRDPKLARIWREIHDTLLKEWDPIGIGDAPQAQDEYNSYIAGVYHLLTTRASEEEIYKHLVKIETERMEIGPCPNTRTAAKKLFMIKIG